MHVSTTNSLRSTPLLLVFGTVILSGCMNPGMYYGNPYAQPMYAPPQTINPGATGTFGSPGSLYIPESSAPAYDPSSSTYETDPGDPEDGFNKADGEFYGTGEDEGGVPTPRGFGDELGVQFSPTDDFGDDGRMPRPSSIQPVSATSAPVEYGFDGENYLWLRGELGYDDTSQSWLIRYSPAARDRFGGRLVLSASAGQLKGLRVGDMIDVHGHVDQGQGRRGPTYHVESLQRISM